MLDDQTAERPTSSRDPCPGQSRAQQNRASAERVGQLRADDEGQVAVGRRVPVSGPAPVPTAPGARLNGHADRQVVPDGCRRCPGLRPTETDAAAEATWRRRLGMIGS